MIEFIGWLILVLVVVDINHKIDRVVKAMRLDK